ncbi:MAG: 5-amino-6-(D-ribitylamino)uracil--L-tyrosine 4-hydroxyphenyl transferase CofH [Methanospirillum sp.]|nr:5-amino-6-(D-ribitylamino)uracil--L-tyrosine 4-hydroxyphenyl transferase CofH [Methanospirillum sp.]
MSLEHDLAGVVRLLDDVEDGHRLSRNEAAGLLAATTGPAVHAIAAAADRARAARTGEAITFVRNQNLNVTNLCVNRCGFCGFSRRKGDPDAFRLSLDDVREAAELARSRGVTEICTVSGLAPDFTGETYAAILEACRAGAPGVHLHAGNPQEIAYGAARSGWTTAEQLERLREAGLGSLCGTAAEILVDPVRRRICPGKVPTAEWVRIIREAHGMGVRSTATILYGVGESVDDRVEHLSVLREIQDETGGFTEFVPLSFIHQNTPLYRAGKAPAGATGREDLLLTAVARLFLDNFEHVQASWVKVGTKLSSLLLLAGADDLGGTLYEEHITSAAGGTGGSYLDPAEMERIAADLGRPLVERTTLYGRVG